MSFNTSVKTTGHHSRSVNTDSIVPFECEGWNKKPLFIVKGEIRGGDFPATVYGDAYSYENFPWPEGMEKMSKKTCKLIAQQNNRTHHSLWVTDKLCKQFKKILGE